MKTNLKEQVQVTYASMLEGVKTCFSASNQDHLRCLIRLTFEFDDYLKNGHPDLLERIRRYNDQHHLNMNIKIQPHKLELDYSIDSIFSGLDSFCAVTSAYRVLSDTIESKIGLSTVSTLSVLSLKEQFAAMFNEFIGESNFEKKCRLLLDLFKLQIIFAAMLYE